MQSWFEFLKLEAGLARTFIEAARIHSNPEDSARSLGNARKALAEIQRSVMNPIARGLNRDEVIFLKQRSAEIQLELARFKTSH